MGEVPLVATSRLNKEYQKILKEPIPYVTAAPLPDNILEWHYVMFGVSGTPYEGGIYHGKLIFPPDFPFSPPKIFMITPSGRFTPNYPICLSMSDYHPETWNPGWTVSAILIGLQSFMNEESHSRGSIVVTNQKRCRLAMKSLQFNLKDPEFLSAFPDLVVDLQKIES